MVSFGKLLGSKAPFLAAVFATLAVQLLITFGIVAYLRTGTPEAQALADKVQAWAVPLVFMVLALVIVLAFVPMGLAPKLVLMASLSALMGAVLGAVVRAVPTDVLRGVLLSTVGVFAAMIVVGVGLAATGADLPLLGFVLLVGLISVAVSQVVLLFVEHSSGARRALATIAVVIVSMYVAYHTGTIVQREYTGDFASAALDYYAGFMSLFDELATLASNNYP